MKKLYAKIVAASAIFLFGVFLFDVIDDSDNHHSLARDPMSIEKILDVQLPQYTVVESSDNLERETSRFDCFSHSYIFRESFSPSMIEKLDELCEKKPLQWSKSHGAVSYSYQRGDWDAYYIECGISETGAHLDYYVDELGDGIAAVIEWIFIIMVWLAAVLVLGIVMLVVSVVKKVLNKKRVESK